LPTYPDWETIRRVNSRQFCANLGQTLPAARYVYSEEELLDALPLDHLGHGFLCKRAFGFTGKGQRRIAGPTLLDSDQAWVRASLQSGDGLQVEPLLDRVSDFGWHGYISQSREILFGEPTRQEISKDGVWMGTRLAEDGDLFPKEVHEFKDKMMQVAQALVAESYWGPFGIDAFRYRTSSDTFSFQTCSDINARLSMGWAVGMANRKEEALVRMENESI
jgi:hypothetical protein